MAVEIGEFKGNAMLKLFGAADVNKKFAFCFGVNKAKMIVENYEEIKKFIEEHQKEGGKDE